MVCNRNIKDALELKQRGVLVCKTIAADDTVDKSKAEVSADVEAEVAPAERAESSSSATDFGDNKNNSGAEFGEINSVEAAPGSSDIDKSTYFEFERGKDNDNVKDEGNDTDFEHFDRDREKDIDNLGKKPKGPLLKPNGEKEI